MMRAFKIILGGMILNAAVNMGVWADEFYISPLLGDHFYDSKTAPDLQYPAKGVNNGRQFTLGLGYRFTPNWGVEGDIGRSTPNLPSPYLDRFLHYHHADFNLMYRFNADGHLQPFVLAGAGRARYQADLGPNFQKDYGQAGAGLMWAYNDRFAVRTEGRYMEAGGHWKDWVALVGMEFRFGQGAFHEDQEAADTSADTAAPATAEPVAAEPAATPVAEPAPVPVVADDDHDGVPNDQDKCPNTPAGVQVDAQGCPLDSDHDGVPDYLDKCPNTKPGAAVDAQGCYVMVNQDQSIRLDINFETNKAVIHGDASAQLHKLIDFMHQYPDVNVVIEGYTDNVGNAQANQLLSQRRADVVRNVLVSAGVDASRLKAVGYGESRPVASNATEQGRSENRRVVATVHAQSSYIKMKSDSNP
ncbi:MAG: OmpA family protein [Pseudomonadales bacterium]|nr:OmpA family protein [Pseudomonadales bacterium]